MRVIKIYSLIGLAALAASATAQQRQPDLDEGELAAGQTVADRSHDAYQAKGLKAGSFRVYPKAELTLTYDDNVFFQDVNETEDFIATIAPSVRFVSDWNNHKLDFEIGSEIKRFADNGDEESEDYFLTANTKIDVTRQTNITGALSLRNGHEGRGDPNAVNGVAPTETDTVGFQVGFEHRPGRFFVLGHASLDQLAYDNVNTSTGAVINNADRDRDQQVFSLTLGYEIQPGYNAFIRGTVDERDYDSAVDDNGFNRDSESTKVELGAELDVNGIFNGVVSLGNESRDYDDARFATSDNWSTQSKLFWQLSPLTTVVFNASREIAESTENNASGFSSMTVGAGFAHELKRNLILESALNLTENDFDGINRTDDIVTFDFRATYDIDRNLFFVGSYQYSDRESNAAGVDYSRNVINFTIGYRM